jgi:hypothetical protein
MIAEREVVDIKPVEKAPTAVEERPVTAVSPPQPKWSDKLFIASNICLLTGLLLIIIAMLLPIGVVTAIETVFALGLFLLITEVSLFVVGAMLFALGFVWPRIK